MDLIFSSLKVSLFLKRNFKIQSTLTVDSSLWRMIMKSFKQRNFTTRLSPQRCIVALALVAASATTMSQSAQAVGLGSGYTQNFDSMGTSGTTPPTDWVVYTGNSGTTNTTWTTTISGNGANSVASMVAAPTSLTAVTTPTTTNNNGLNAARTSGTLNDRVLATSPTTVSGAALQLLLTNNTGSALSGLQVSFETVRYNAASTANQLPGYWLFYSLNNVTWTNVASLNPTSSTVPNTAGFTQTNGSFNFSTSVASGANFYLRWVDDNAVETSPDQIIGLNNVNIAAVPEPSMFTGSLAFGAFFSLYRKRKNVKLQ
jgi:hypothetical protein